MNPAEFASESSQPHAIIGGYGLPGRCIAELLQARQIPFRIIDLNPTTASRAASSKISILVGDMRDEAILLEAGLDRARLIAITIPDEHVTLEIIQVIRRLRPDIPIVTRCAYTSIGLKARQLGATHVIVAEQLIAQEFSRLIDTSLPRPIPPA
ncbi:MAG TPA: NAD(P)-binding protein [Tepidisphaeraceae bacterium]|nr:NAD(P)-binding protein [Tepidisphaeraceae bacterium]